MNAQPPNQPPGAPQYGMYNASPGQPAPAGPTNPYGPPRGWAAPNGTVPPSSHGAASTVKKRKRWIVPAVIGAVTFVLGIAASGGTTEVEVAGPETTTTVTTTATATETAVTTTTATATATATITETLRVEVPVTPAPVVEVPVTPAPVVEAPAQAPPPQPLVAEEPTPAAPAPDAYYKNCDAVRAAGADPIRAGEPGYRKGLDRDGDGVGCE